MPLTPCWRPRKWSCQFVTVCWSFLLFHWLIQRFTVPRKGQRAAETSDTWDPTKQLSTGYGHLPFPIENVSRLPVAFNVVESCKASLDYIFFVHTAPDHREHRDTIRASLGNSTLAARYNWTTVFFVGISPSNDTREKVSIEAKQFGDTVVLPYMDTYENLTYKYIYGIKWTMDNCPLVKYNVKMDDDMVVHLPNLLRYMGKLNEGRSPSFHCSVFKRRPVLRNSRSKWYLSRDAYPNDTFPDYCTGGIVLLRTDALERLYRLSFRVPFIGIDDVYVTGDLARLAGVGHVHLDWPYWYVVNSWQKVAKGDIMFTQVHHHTFRLKAWRTILEQL